jgi:hypothetical protein
MNLALRSNKLVNTDAQGRLLGRYAPCAPLRGRGLHARYPSTVAREILSDPASNQDADVDAKSQRHSPAVLLARTRRCMENA